MEITPLNNNLLTDFINLRPLTLETLEGLYKRHNLSHYKLTVDGFDIPENAYCMVDSVYTAYLFRPIIHDSVKIPRPKDIPKGFSDTVKIITPTDFFAERLLLKTKDLQHTYRDFIDDCIRGNLNLSFINTRSTFLILGNSRLCFEKSDRPWNPTVSLAIRELTIEKWLDLIITQTLLSGEGEFFSKIKRCLQCGDYFVVKSKKAKFCSDKCRMTYHQESKVAE